MNHAWALQDAKAHFSEVVKKAENEGPQIVSVRGNPTVVIISQDEYLALITRHETIVDFFQNSPLKGMRFNIKRDKSLNRDVDL
ncbi:MAG TPA: type II toxin-antitoxin system Phd/YefM family antitoxin [Coxiellaceae bacterium]|nr:type II toxin-antitoxin system Phd/YefM family antitoxin [Coxiellaceae bacterium]